MDEINITFFKSGYDECRAVILEELKELIEKIPPKILKHKIQLLTDKLEDDAEEEHWKAIQEEFPGITREAYEAELDTFVKEVRKTYYSEKGILKPRLVRFEEG